MTLRFAIKNCMYVDHLMYHYNNKVVITITIIIEVNNNLYMNALMTACIIDRQLFMLTT